MSTPGEPGTTTLDCRGLRCPMPVIELAKAWPAVPVGGVVELLSDDPASASDVPAWCRMREQAYDGSPRPGVFLVRRIH